MQLFVLGSGSRGNCFALMHDGATLLVDAGFSASEIERRAAIAGLSLDRLVGIAITHEHGDHATGALRLARTRQAPVFCSPGTWTALDGHGDHRPLAAVSRADVGPFTLSACPTSHDAAEPIALAVETLDGTSVGFAYDLGRPTSAVRYLLRGRTALVLEANHDEMRLRTSSYPPSVQQRIAGSGGHLSNRAAAELLAELWHADLGAVILAHLSERCNDADEACSAIAPVLAQLGFRGQLLCARQEQPLEMIDVRPPHREQMSLAM